MSLTVEDGGGGSFTPGTAGSVCAISPADLVGTVGNLISRIEHLETTLSQILGANLHAQTLGDISSQVGWVYGVEYMGVPGWIQTEYGTLIPPPGFTMSGSGMQLYNACTGEYEDYQAVVMDENGVLQWGATTAGNLCGAKVEEWNDAAAGGAQDYGVISYSGSPAWNSVRGMSIATNSRTSTNINLGFTIATAGLYMVMGAHTAFKTSGATSSSDTGRIWKNSTIMFQNSVNIVPGGSNIIPISISGVLPLQAGETISYINSPGVGLTGISNGNFSVVRISS